jgi:hypothetical protein
MPGENRAPPEGGGGWREGIGESLLATLTGNDAERLAPEEFFIIGMRRPVG